jgi:hypothetical protein
MPEIRRNGRPMRGIEGFDSLEGPSPAELAVIGIGDARVARTCV